MVFRFWKRRVCFAGVPSRKRAFVYCVLERGGKSEKGESRDFLIVLYRPLVPRDAGPERRRQDSFWNVLRTREPKGREVEGSSQRDNRDPSDPPGNMAQSGVEEAVFTRLF